MLPKMEYIFAQYQYTRDSLYNFEKKFSSYSGTESNNTKYGCGWLASYRKYDDSIIYDD